MSEHFRQEACLAFRAEPSNVTAYKGLKEQKRFKKNHLPGEIGLYAVELTGKAFQLFRTYYEIAQFLKNEFDRKYGGKWHCIVGDRFESLVDPTYPSEHYVCYIHNGVEIELFRTL
ncbi:unnamed protein product [Caenorhabditis auriculariae]|uniref:Dynein light chain n=1 Tax=Caenorhabditis auriculariae TaxID=2777116 RepID=A0A8S1H1S6_9PELO|nr:unnamed protein product [Caenorhabditis auriculariae]